VRFITKRLDFVLLVTEICYYGLDVGDLEGLVEGDFEGDVLGPVDGDALGLAEGLPLGDDDGLGYPYGQPTQGLSFWALLVLQSSAIHH
jgi:hypothetical protein